MNLDDTIVAVATPAGRGGIGVVRLSGPESCRIAAPILRLKSELASGRAVFGELVDRDSTRIDEVVVSFFQKPHSYTTDDVVEISAHGSPVVLHHIVGMCLDRGARLAEPGEFTMRAFLNGRLDLTQAEAVRDLIESQTIYQAKVAAQQLEGALSQRIQPVKQKLVELVAELEAGVDFAEDDVAVMPGGAILAQLDLVRGPLQGLAESFAYGKIVHEGLTLAIVGLPNVGKSSLFNRLVERERAIVTATPGTTRDLVTETVSIGGIPVKLVDTAGIRETADEAEGIGVRKSREVLADADVVLVVVDASRPVEAADRELLPRAGIVVGNKMDIAGEDGAERFRRELQPLLNGSELAMVSAMVGTGLEDLRAAILRRSGGVAEPGMLTNLRHQSLVRDALAGLDASRGAVEAEVPHEMLLMDLYNALRALDELTGATTTDDVLNLIFGKFCIGK